MFNKKIALINEEIYPFPNIRKKFEALIIKNKRIAFIGSNKEVLRKINKIKNIEIIDLKGKTVILGLIDTHVHLSSFGLLLKQINLRKIYFYLFLKKLKHVNDINNWTSWSRKNNFIKKIS